jgi:Tfp pilus assembly protein PilO
MKNMSLTSKVLLSFTIPLVLAYVFLVLPQIRATAQGLADVDALRDAVSPASTSSKQKDDVKAKINSVRTEASKLLPATDEQYDLSVQVENLAKDNKLTITALSLNAAQPTNLPKTTPTSDVPTSEGPSTTTVADVPASAALKVTVIVGVQGTYTDVQHFIAELPALDRFVQIDQFVLSTGGNGAISAQITAFAYYLPAVK